MDKLKDKDHKPAVQQYYGQTLKTSKDLKTNACCAIPDYSEQINHILKDIHPEIKEKFYGCGLSIPQKLGGLSVLDLGSGSGRDSFLVSKLVGEKGRVTGVDMTKEQLQVARKHIGHQSQVFGFKQPNVEFLEGNIEKLDQLGLAEQSYDLIISNCVINLVNDKTAVLKQVYKLLKEGGEMFFSDVYCDRRIPPELVDDPVLYGECLSGALYWNDYQTIVKQVGFADPRWMDYRKLTIGNQELIDKLGGINFYSITCRLIKITEIEPDCEDYGQAVRYLGGVEGQENNFILDTGHNFSKGKIEPVCGNSYLMLKKSRFRDDFDFFGDFSTHQGVFPGCGGSMPFNNNNKISENFCC